MKKILLATCLGLWGALAMAAELSGIFIDDEIKMPGGQTLLLNGAGLREKFWVDVYVGSLYLPSKSSDVAEILSRHGPWRVQLDFVYKEVDREKLITAWREGFEEQYAFDYIPDQGVRITRNDKVLGMIAGKDFKNALLEIWLGNRPADKKLKKGMLGL
jgi:hypothetical protein